MYLIDTDTVSLAFRAHPRVSVRLSQTPSADVFVSSLTVEEVINGLLAEINRVRSTSFPNVTTSSRRLVEAMRAFTRFQLLAYSDEAERLFRSFPASVKRVGAMDCRIAAHALVAGFTVVTRNTQEFARIPGVKIEDWSV